MKIVISHLQLAFGFALAAWLIPHQARAQDDPTGDYQTTTTEDGYSVEFEDDPLAALGSGPRHDWIRVRFVGLRTLLIRPRLHFVPEMLQSAEDL